MSAENPTGADATASEAGSRDGLWAAVIAAGIRWSIFGAALFVAANFVTGTLIVLFENYQMRVPTPTAVVFDISQWMAAYQLPSAAVLMLLASLDATVLNTLDSHRRSKVWREIWNGLVLIGFAFILAYWAGAILFPLVKLAQGLGRR